MTTQQQLRLLILMPVRDDLGVRLQSSSASWILLWLCAGASSTFSWWMTVRCIAAQTVTFRVDSLPFAQR